MQYSSALFLLLLASGGGGRGGTHPSSSSPALFAQAQEDVTEDSCQPWQYYIYSEKKGGKCLLGKEIGKKCDAEEECLTGVCGLDDEGEGESEMERMLKKKKKKGKSKAVCGCPTEDACGGGCDVEGAVCVRIEAASPELGVCDVKVRAKMADVGGDMDEEEEGEGSNGKSKKGKKGKKGEADEGELELFSAGVSMGYAIGKAKKGKCLVQKAEGGGSKKSKTTQEEDDGTDMGDFESLSYFQANVAAQYINQIEEVVITGHVPSLLGALLYVKGNYQSPISQRDVMSQDEKTGHGEVVLTVVPPGSGGGGGASAGDSCDFGDDNQLTREFGEGHIELFSCDVGSGQEATLRGPADESEKPFVLLLDTDNFEPVNITVDGSLKMLNMELDFNYLSSFKSGKASIGSNGNIYLENCDVKGSLYHPTLDTPGPIRCIERKHISVGNAQHVRKNTNEELATYRDLVARVAESRFRPTFSIASTLALGEYSMPDDKEAPTGYKVVLNYRNNRGGTAQVETNQHPSGQVSDSGEFLFAGNVPPQFIHATDIGGLRVCVESVELHIESAATNEHYKVLEIPMSHFRDCRCVNNNDCPEGAESLGSYNNGQECMYVGTANPNEPSDFSLDLFKSDAADKCDMLSTFNHNRGDGQYILLVNDGGEQTILDEINWAAGAFFRHRGQMSDGQLWVSGKFPRGLMRKLVSDGWIKKKEYDSPYELGDGIRGGGWRSGGVGVQGLDGQQRRDLTETTPYGLAMVQANDSAFDSIIMNKKICIIDSGYDNAHTDLPTAEGTNMTLTNEGTTYDFTWSTDENGHGTHVAGIIAALSGNDRGTAGVIGQDRTYLHIVPILGNAGFVTRSSDIMTAMDKCKDAGTHIIHMSLESSSWTTTEQDKFQTFANDGILVVASAGNEGTGAALLQNSMYPGSYPSVLSVGAVNENEAYAKKTEVTTFCGGGVGFTSQNNGEVDLVAPGVGVYSTIKGNATGCKDGTSQAAPFVTGIAGLIWSQYPNCSRDDVYDALKFSAKTLGSAGDKHMFGEGLLQGKAALDRLAAKTCATT